VVFVALGLERGAGWQVRTWEREDDLDPAHWPLPPLTAGFNETGGYLPPSVACPCRARTLVCLCGVRVQPRPRRRRLMLACPPARVAAASCLPVPQPASPPPHACLSPTGD